MHQFEMCELNGDEKVAELIGLLEATARFIAGEQAPGSLDACMLPWLVDLNRIDGLCTLQSCEGHRRDGYVSDGHLWLRMSKRLEKRLVARMTDALALPRIGSISIDYHRHKGNVRPIVSLTFEGLERHPNLDGAMIPLVRFLSELAA